MSSGGQIVGGIVGAVIGWYTGGPAGAFRGAALGAGIGGYIDPPAGPNLRGPTLDDNTFQSTAYGVPIARLHGTMATMGNIIYLENNKYKAVSKKEEQDAKGGGGATVTTTTYYATFAISLSDPIPGSLVRRIWAGGKLIYSAGVNDIGTIIQSEYERRAYDVFRGIESPVNPGWSFYDGTQEDPDSRMEAVLGVGSCPSYEGTAYIIFYDLDLTNYGNGLAGCPIKVEISTAGDDAAEEKFKLIKYTDVTHNIPIDANIIGSCNAADTNFNASLLCNQYPPGLTNKYGSCFFTNGYYETVGEPSNAEPGTGGRPIFGNSDSSSYWFKYTYRVPPSNFAESVTNGDSYHEFPVGYTVRRVYESRSIGRFFEVDDNLGNEKIVTSANDASINYNFELVAIGEERIFIFQDSWIYAYDKDLLLVDVIPCSFADEVDQRNAAAVRGNKIYVAYNLPGFSDEMVFRVVNLTDGSWEEYSADLPEGIFRYPAGSAPTMVVRGSIICLGDVFGPDDTNCYGFMYFNIDGILSVDGNARANLAEVVGEIISYSEIDSSSIDLAALETFYVDGYRYSGDTSLRSAISPLQVAYLFDLIEDGYSIKAVIRGNQPEMLIPYNNLMMDGDKIVQSSCELSSTFPSRYKINYIDYNREYDASVQYADYPSNFNNVRAQDLAVVMSADAAATLSERLLNASWIERYNYSIKVPQIYLELKVADPITVETSPGWFIDMRIDSLSQGVDGVIDLSLKASNYLSYQLEAVGQVAEPPPETIPFTGETLSVLMDIPMMNSVMDVFGFVAGVYTKQAWPGASLMRSMDNGQVYTGIQYFNARTTVAQCRSSIPENDGYTIDYVSSLSASVIWGEFNSVTEFQMMTGKNFAAYGADGRWEILQFINADIQTDGTTLFSGFVRGMRGTEWATGMHQVNDFFVLLDDPDNLFIGDDSTSINNSRLYKSVTVGSTPAATTAKTFTYKGVNLRPLSPVNAAGSRAGGNLTITWSARTRYQSSYWYSGVLAQNESVMSWVVDILNGSTVVRTILSSTTIVEYTSAQQVIDFGSAQSSVSIKIYQISQRVGRGYPLGATL